ncbi:MAG: DUF6382 domain-containing protein [Eubacteriales bacterium]|nr:DUF6382 domain-containing protein [Eubacteriales bacterium]
MNYAEYRRDLNHCYMILKTDEEGEAAPEWQTGILEANRIPGLLPMAEEHIDNETCYRYDVTSVQPFDIFCRMKRIGKDDLKKMLVSLVTSLGALDDYLLDADHLLLDPEYLYIDGVAEELRIPYVPCRSRDIRESLRELMEYLLLRVDHEDQECVVFASRILHELKEVNTELSDLPGLLTNDGLHHRPSGPEHADPEELLADAARTEAAGSSRSLYDGLGTDGGNFTGEKSERRRDRKRGPVRKMRGAHGTGSGMGARAGAADERHGGNRGTDPAGAVRQDTVRAVLAEEKRKLIPEAKTVQIALAGAAVAAAVYLFLHAGILIYASPAEAALAAAAAAAAVLAAGFALMRRRRKKEAAGAAYVADLRGQRSGRTVQEVPEMSSPAAQRSRQMQRNEENLHEKPSAAYREYQPGAGGQNSEALPPAAHRGHQTEAGGQNPEASPPAEYWGRQGADRAETASDMSLWEKPHMNMQKSPSQARYAEPEMEYKEAGDDEEFRPDSVLQSAGAGNGQIYGDDSDETVLLGAGGIADASPRGMSAELVPAHSGTDLPVIRLEGREVLVGKHARAVDVVLPSGTVSRIHARLFMSGGEYYLSDLGSKNGTSVDGHMAVGNEEIRLTDGAGVKFADLEYVFRRSGGSRR